MAREVSIFVVAFVFHAVLAQLSKAGDGNARRRIKTYWCAKHPDSIGGSVEEALLRVFYLRNETDIIPKPMNVDMLCHFVLLYLARLRPVVLAGSISVESSS